MLPASLGQHPVVFAGELSDAVGMGAHGLLLPVRGGSAIAALTGQAPAANSSTSPSVNCQYAHGRDGGRYMTFCISPGCGYRSSISILGGDAMRTSVRASATDLRALAGIVSQDRPDVPPEEGLPPSLLADLMRQIRCDILTFFGMDSGRRAYWFAQDIPPIDTDGYEDLDRPEWKHYWDCQPCSYPDRSGDLRSIVTIADFYSARQWHATGMYHDLYRPTGREHYIQLCLPEGLGRTPGSGQTVRLVLYRGPGPDFSERDRAVLTLLRPHLHQAYLDAERRRQPARLTPRQWELLRRLAAGHTNGQIARRLACRKEPCASTCRTSTAGCRCQAARPRSPRVPRPAAVGGGAANTTRQRGPGRRPTRR